MMLILAALGFVLLNAFFVLAEFSLVKLRQTQVEKLSKSQGWKGKILIKVHEKLDAYLSACQLGITFASLGLGWIGEPAFAELLEPILRRVGIFSETTIHVTSFFVAFSLISYLHIVVGELMPKSMAIRKPVKMSFLSAIPLYLFYWLMYPIILFLNSSANKMLDWIKLGEIAHQEHFITSEELKIILKSSHHHGELSHREIKTLHHLLELHNLQISDVMRPIEDLIFLDAAKPINETFRTILKYQFSRYPIYKGTKENILGIIHVKDLVPSLFPNNRIQDLQKYTRPILQVISSDSALDLLDTFRKGTSHLALVYSHHELVGFLTFDNLLQVLTGKIKDEFHFTAEDSFDLPDGSFLIKGTASIYTLERILGIDLSKYPVTTVMGLILYAIKKLPSEGSLIDFDQFSLIIEKREDPKHVWIKVIPN
jgi:CBS domain containing-hemolysin-like protein